MKKSRKPKNRPSGLAAKRPADPRLQQAINALNGKHFETGIAILRGILKDSPGDANAHNLMGVALTELGKPTTASEHLANAVRAQPKNPFFLFNLGRAQLQAGELNKAANALKKATRLKPDMAPAHALRGDALRSLDRLSEAQTEYEAAISQQAGLAQAHHGLGLVHLHFGRHGDAAERFRAALHTSQDKAADTVASMHANLGLCMEQLGQKQEAVIHLLEAVDLATDKRSFTYALVVALRNIKRLPSSEKLRNVLLELLNQNHVNPRSISAAIQASIREQDGVPELLGSLNRDPEVQLDELAPYSRTIRALLADDLFRAFLENAPVTDTDLEILVTLLRRTLLEAIQAPGSAASDLIDSWTEDRLSVATMLARQGWLNEYVFYTTTAEHEALGHLQKALANCASSEQEFWEILAVAAAYTPLYGWELELPATEIPDSFAAIIKQHIEDTDKEMQIRSSLATLTPMQDQTSLAVQDQYEQNPYPRWTRYDVRPPMSLSECVQADLPHLSQAMLPNPERPRVLIAGCGTGIQTMKAATGYANASILAVDLSRASLAYGMRMLEEYGIDSVDHLNADILDLDQLDEQFDLVESYGVIHHMADTGKAMGLLANRLKPGGIMYLGLYSEIGRQSVVKVRELIAQRGYSQDDSGIRQARRDIMRELDPALAPLLSPASDFWTMSDTRDLIFHVQEHRFTLLEIGRMIESCGLTFLGLALRNPADKLVFSQEFPEADAARSISNWHEFEKRHPETFGDTYKIWLQKGIAKSGYAP